MATQPVRVEVLPDTIASAHPELFSFQHFGATWLSKKKYALLADEMGLGKSAQAITAADLAGAQTVLVLCPAVARLNWIREFAKFSKRTLTCGALLTSKDALKPLADVTICSYDLAMTSAVCSKLSGRRWSVLVLDESHYLKSRTAKRTKAALEVLAGVADRVWCLSGTPAPNHPAELWPVLARFGLYARDYWSFVGRFCTSKVTPFGTQITGGRRIEELRALMAPVLLRRKKDEVMKDLPKIMFSDVVVEQSPVDIVNFEKYFGTTAVLAPHLVHKELDKQRRIVETFCSELGGAANGDMQILAGLAHKVKSLRQWVGIQKVPKVVEMVKAELEARAYDKIVLFAIHQSVIEGLREALKSFGAVVLYGGTPPEKRDLHIRKFQNDPKCRVFIGQVVAAGTAITLTAAHQVMFVEADWTPANNQQAAMRVHRIGQTKPVTVRFVGMAGSIDERIQQVLRRKTKTLTALFDTAASPVHDVFAD